MENTFVRIVVDCSPLKIKRRGYMNMLNINNNNKDISDLRVFTVITFF